MTRSVDAPVAAALANLAAFHPVSLGIGQEGVHIRDVPVYEEAWYALTGVAWH